jgi:hypothetical protein
MKSPSGSERDMSLRTLKTPELLLALRMALPTRQTPDARTGDKSSRYANQFRALLQLHFLSQVVVIFLLAIRNSWPTLRWLPNWQVQLWQKTADGFPYVCQIDSTPTQNVFSHCRELRIACA